MTIPWKTWPYLVSLGLLLCLTGAVEQFQLEPVNVTKLQGSDAQFKATVQGKWSIMTWTVGQFLVLTVQLGGNVTSDSDQFSASFNACCVEFIIHNVTRSNSGPVMCTVQGMFGSKTSQLYVQENGSVSIMGGDRMAKQDKQVEFQCETAAWFPAATISWTLNGQTVSSSLVTTTNVANGDTYNSSSVLKFQAVHNTTVTCLATIPALPEPHLSSVQLGIMPDWTVLIAIVVSFSGFALLVLLIIGVIFCYKRRKEKRNVTAHSILPEVEELTYQDEMMRQRTQSQLSNRPTITRQGQVNPVFAIDGHMSLPPSEHSDSGFFQTNGGHFYEQPATENSIRQGNGSNSAYSLEVSFPKHRHVTIV